MQAICVRPYTDVRNIPEKRTAYKGKDIHQETQLLFGDTVTIEKEQGRWVYVSIADQHVWKDGWKGYAGWVEKEALSTSICSPNYQVIQKQIVFADSLLPLGSRVYLEQSRINKHDVMSLEQTLSKQDCLALGCSMAGDPYVWGGLTAYHPNAPGTGYDCSSLVYILYRLHGITLPRNARDQFRVCMEVEADALEPFDLIFLRKEASPYIDHVMLYLGDHMVLEATLLSGTVRIISTIERLGKPVHQLVSGSFYNNNQVFLCKGSLNESSLKKSPQD